ncbi:MAG: hypothetical protein CBE43_00615 [Rhodopirellula sp. TMED283]|nr:MAG: hypothetical protein CBE43_00615 [Rhodopirellula sp. TMED283]
MDDLAFEWTGERCKIAPFYLPTSCRACAWNPIHARDRMTDPPRCVSFFLQGFVSSKTFVLGGIGSQDWFCLNKPQMNRVVNAQSKLCLHRSTTMPGLSHVPIHRSGM